MGFDTFMVVLEPEQPVYIAGQALTGYLRVTSGQEVSCRNIIVSVKGEAKVHWSEKNGKTRTHYRAEEKYFKHQALVWSGDDSDNSMSRGDHKFPFHFVLPQNIPSSFMSYIGKVVYQVKAEADRPWALNQTHKVFFSVNYMYDLNDDPLSLIPVRLQREKTVCCCCCAQGPIELSLATHRSGYVPGESIVINGEIVNHTGSTIKYTEVKLIQKINYITRTKNRTEERTVQRVYHPQVAPRGRDAWDSVPLPVPAVPASHLKHCNIITIDYELVLVAKLGTCRRAKVKCPLIIGSLPLRGTYSSFRPGRSTTVMSDHPLPMTGGTIVRTPAATHRPAIPAHSPPTQPSAPPAESYLGPPPPYSSILPDRYRDVPPPSYASCVFGGGPNRLGDDDAADSDAGDYAPRYLTYTTQV